MMTERESGHNCFCAKTIKSSC